MGINLFTRPLGREFQCSFRLMATNETLVLPDHAGWSWLKRHQDCSCTPGADSFRRREFLHFLCTYPGNLCEPSHIVRVPISTGTSSRGVHMVNSCWVPRFIYTLSTWAPVKPSWYIPLDNTMTEWHNNRAGGKRQGILVLITKKRKNALGTLKGRQIEGGVCR